MSLCVYEWKPDVLIESRIYFSQVEFWSSLGKIKVSISCTVYAVWGKLP